jgi:protein-L-isoaspartate(D-aspartate) O-methyltransferase
MLDNARIEFVLKLRARGLRDTNVLRALEVVPRELFVPHIYADLAGKDIALPIRCGQSMPSPFDVARMLEIMDIQPHHRILEIGTGSGYTTAILARMAEEIVSVERFQSLTVEAKARMAQLGLRHVSIAWADGLSLDPKFGVFDRILVHGRLDHISQSFLAALAEQGILVSARTVPDEPLPLLTRMRWDDTRSLLQTSFGGIRAMPLISGLS